MFTGLVQHLASIDSVARSETGMRLVIDANGWLRDAQPGESIAVNGCCLTLVRADASRLHFDVVPQTLALTTLGSLQAGAAVNLERSLRADALLGGHLVQGHVEAVGTVVGVDRSNQGWRTRIEAPGGVHDLLVERGSVAVDGVSLTVAAVGPGWFEVALIPETLERTTLRQRLAGSRVNLEPDVLARMVAEQVRRQLHRADPRA